YTMRDKSRRSGQVDTATFEAVSEAWESPGQYVSISEATDNKLDELSDEHARMLALELLLLWWRRNPSAVEAPEYGPEWRLKLTPALDFSRPNKRQKFTNEVEIESALRFNRYVWVDKLPAKEAISKVQAWQRENTPDARTASESQIYQWR